MVCLPIVLGDRGPDCENSKEPILLQWRDIEEALYNYCVLNLAFSFFSFFFDRKSSVFEHLLKADPHLRHFV